MKRRLVSIAAAAERLSCSRGHIYHLIAAGELSSVDIHAQGNRSKTRVFDDELDQFIESRTA